LFGVRLWKCGSSAVIGVDRPTTSSCAAAPRENTKSAAVASARRRECIGGPFTIPSAQNRSAQASRYGEEQDGFASKTTLFPITLQRLRLAVRMDPPKLGEHTRELLGSTGYRPGEIDALMARSAVA
jgi:crotonobetainyl-CoA:carnitine CoA-transferase CaiB-like acyl-CoA transferase